MEEELHVERAAAPPFDSTAVCPKCGHRVIHAAWRHGLEWSDVDSEYRRYGVPRVWYVDREHIRRVCQRCSFLWVESIAPETGPSLSFVRREVLDVLETDMPRSPRRIADLLGKTAGAVQQILRDLLRDGHVERIGHGEYVLARPRQAIGGILGQANEAADGDPETAEHAYRRGYCDGWVECFNFLDGVPKSKQIDGLDAAWSHWQTGLKEWASAPEQATVSPPECALLRQAREE